MRRKISKRKSRYLFKKYAKRTHKKNIHKNIFRGGICL